MAYEKARRIWAVNAGLFRRSSNGRVTCNQCGANGAIGRVWMNKHIDGHSVCHCGKVLPTIRLRTHLAEVHGQRFQRPRRPGPPFVVLNRFADGGGHGGADLAVAVQQVNEQMQAVAEVARRVRIQLNRQGLPR